MRSSALRLATLAPLMATLAAAARCGIDLDVLGEQLQAEGLAQFEQAFERLMAAVA